MPYKHYFPKYSGIIVKLKGQYQLQPEK